MKYFLFLVSIFSFISFDLVGQNQCLDLSFANAGIMQLNFGTDSIFPKSIALQQDGKIVVGSDIVNGLHRDFILSRFNSDGSIDSNFGINGSLIIDFDNNSKDCLKKIIVLLNGKILLGGNSKMAGFYKYVFTRINSNGTIDNTFGINGKISHYIVANEHHFLQDMLVKADSKIAFVGHSNINEQEYNHYYFYYWMNGQKNYVIQLNSDGSIDNGFNSSGYFHLLSNLPIVLNRIATLQTQELVFTGFGSVVAGGWRKIVIGKLNSVGNIDSTFGINGFSDLNSAPIIHSEQIIVDNSNNILIQGNIGDNAWYGHYFAKLNSAGVIDSSFNFFFPFYFSNIYKNCNTFIVNETLINLTDGYLFSDSSYHLISYSVNSQANLDTNSCGHGQIVVEVAPTNIDNSIDAAMQNDFKILQLGSMGFNNLTIVRYLNPIINTVEYKNKPVQSPSLFPNPASNSIKIINGLGQMQISDILGNVIRTFIVNQNDFNINISDYSNGIYFISLMTENKELFNLKFIKE